MTHIVVASLILAVACVVQGGEANTRNNVKRTLSSEIQLSYRFPGSEEQHSADSISLGGGPQFFIQDSGSGIDSSALNRHHGFGGSSNLHLGIGKFLESHGSQNSGQNIDIGKFLESHGSQNSGQNIGIGKFLEPHGSQNSGQNIGIGKFLEPHGSQNSGQNVDIGKFLESHGSQNSGQNVGIGKFLESHGSQNIGIGKFLESHGSQNSGQNIGIGKFLESHGSQNSGQNIGIGKFLESHGSQSSGHQFNNVHLEGGFQPIASSGGSYSENNSGNDQSNEALIQQTGHHGATVSTVTQTVPVPVPQPYPVTITRKVPVPVPQPIAVPVPRPVKVFVPVPKPVYVPRPVPVTVARKVPYPVRVPVKVAVPEPVELPVPQPYAVTVPQPYPVRVRQNIVVPVPQYVSVGGGAGFGGRISDTYYGKTGLSGSSLGLSDNSKHGSIVLQPLTHSGSVDFDTKSLSLQNWGEKSVDYTGISSGEHLNLKSTDTGKSIYSNLGNFEGADENNKQQPLW